MHHLLVVDDEHHWADYLADHMNWTEAGIGTVYKAYSAAEALELLNCQPIDIVLTDIWMSDMNGIELLGRIREAGHFVKCIVLSGHSDFEYAQQALQRNAFDYILKPPKDEELLDVVRKASEALRTEWEQIASYERSMSVLRENLPSMKAKLLHQYLKGQRVSEQQWRNKSQEYQLPIKFGDQCVIMMVRMEGHFNHYGAQDQELIEFALTNMAEEIFKGSFHLWHTKDEFGYLVFVLSFAGKAADEQELLLQRLSARYQHKVKQYLKGTISVLLSQIGPFPEHLASVYERALYAFRQKVGSDREILMTVEDVRDQPGGTVDALYSPPSLMHLMEAGRWDAAEEKLLAILDQLSKSWPDSQEHIFEAGFTIAGAFHYIAHKNGKYLAQLMPSGYYGVVEGKIFRSIAQLREWSHSTLALLKEQTQAELKLSRNDIVRKAQQYIEMHLEQDVSLQAIADQVYVHPTHLSKLYKQETGEGLSEYIFRLRMEKASYLLTNTTDKIYEIGEKVGLPHAAYFIKVFKKEFGVTPQEYRER